MVELFIEFIGIREFFYVGILLHTGNQMPHHVVSRPLKNVVAHWKEMKNIIQYVLC